MVANGLYARNVFGGNDQRLRALAAHRDERLEAAMATARRAVELARTLRAGAGLKTRQPLSRMWLALPGAELAERDALLDLVRDELNVKAVELIGDEHDLVDRREIGRAHV